ncbi:MAG: hypothetical protein M3082_10105 [Candidatus Dormibacteraeota bacterium]|nr:hypothetical protein [Candidatus Dormibacteraeota bacterium]
MRQLTMVERKARLIELYRRYQQRQARVQQSMAGIGVDAFLSGHEGWHFHRGLRRTTDKRD